MSSSIHRIVQSVLHCRAIDLHEQRLADAGKPLAHQFSAAGHELGQAMVAVHATDPADGVFSYYRSKCAWLSAGLSIDAYVQSARQNAGSYADGRNVSVLPYLRQTNGPTIAPIFGGVGSQFEPAIGWAKAITLSNKVPDRPSPLTFVFAGDGAVSTVGFWSAIREASAFQLPMLIVIENNGIALGTASTQQVAGGTIAESLASFVGLSVHSFDGKDPANISEIQHVIQSLRANPTPTLIELAVPRLAGHSGSKSIRKEEATANVISDADPVPRLRSFLLNSGALDADAYQQEELLAEQEVQNCFEADIPSISVREISEEATRHRHSAHPIEFSHPYGANKVSLAHAINAWLASALASDSSTILLGEDIGEMGGVHGVTRGLQTRFGNKRVIDASLNESSILGQAMGLAMAGQRPIVEIQYRKYLDPAMEQFHNIGWCDWLTQSQFTLPIIIRIPFGIGGQSDAWHSESNEAVVLRAIGYDVACPSCANDAVNVFTHAYQSSRPTVILEHRGLYYSPLSREKLESPTSPPNDMRSKVLCQGNRVTIVSWGKLCREIEAMVKSQDVSACEVIDLMWLRDWDFDAVAQSVRKTGRLIVAHEDRRFLGLGAEISARVSEELFRFLKAPVLRVGSDENPIPIRASLVANSCPSVADVQRAIESLMSRSALDDTVAREALQ